MTKNARMARIPEVTCIKGDFGTGKTSQLIARVITLLESGVSPDDIAVYCASPTAAEEFVRLLGVEAGKASAEVATQAAEVKVATPRETFLQVLAEPEAQAITGRDARILAPFEYDFFLEDIKTSGIVPKRLNEMMKFFNKELSALSDFEEGWLMTVEEQELYDLMQNCLGFTRGVLPDEVAGLCVRALEGGAGVKRETPYLLVDDFQLLSRSSQVGVSKLATKNLTIAYNPQLSCAVYEAYPNPEGADELLEENPEATVVILDKTYVCKAAYKATEGLLGAAAATMPSSDEIAKAGIAAEEEAMAQGMTKEEAAAVRAETEAKACVPQVGEVALPAFAGEGMPELIRLSGQQPQQEFKAVAGHVQACLEGGMAPEDVVVVTTQKTWQKNICSMLNKRGIKTSALSSAYVLTGDIRSFEYCDDAQVFTALSLLADPGDGVAWRSFLGFGDYLTNSNGIKILRNYGAMRGNAIDATLDAIERLAVSDTSADGTLSLSRMGEALERCKQLFETCANKKGFELLEAVAKGLLGEGAKVSATMLQLTAVEGGDKPDDFDTAGQMVVRARQRLFFPRVPAQTVRVLPLENFGGIAPKVLIISGLVNGLMPKREYFDATKLTVDKREKRRKEDLRRMAFVASAPTEQLVASTFVCADMLFMERARICTDRIGLLNEVRTGWAQPSVLLEVM